MAIEKVRSHLAQWHVEHKIQELEESSATVELAAQALGCEPARIAKSLSFLVNDGAILIVAAGDAKIDNAKYKAVFGTKAKMLGKDDVEAILETKVIGIIPEDDTMREAVKIKNPVTHTHPNAPSSLGYKHLAAELLGEKYVESVEKDDNLFDYALKRLGLK